MYETDLRFNRLDLLKHAEKYQKEVNEISPSANEQEIKDKLYKGYAELLACFKNLSALTDTDYFENNRTALSHAHEALELGLNIAKPIVSGHFQRIINIVAGMSMKNKIDWTLEPSGKVNVDLNLLNFHANHFKISSKSNIVGNPLTIKCTDNTGRIQTIPVHRHEFNKPIPFDFNTTFGIEIPNDHSIEKAIYFVEFLKY